MVALIVWVLCGYVNYKLAEEHGKDAMLWAIVGVLFGIFGIGALAILLVLESLKKDK